MYAGCAPQGIGSRHPAHQIPEFTPRPWTTRSLAPRNPGPEKTEPSPMPPDHCRGSHHKQRFSPVRPDLREDDPKSAVSGSQPRSWELSLPHGQLLSKGQVLQDQFSPTTRGNEKAGDRKQQPEHATEYQMCPGRVNSFEADAFLANHRSPVDDWDGSLRPSARNTILTA